MQGHYNFSQLAVQRLVREHETGGHVKGNERPLSCKLCNSWNHWSRKDWASCRLFRYKTWPDDGEQPYLKLKSLLLNLHTHDVQGLMKRFPKFGKQFVKHADHQSHSIKPNTEITSPYCILQHQKKAGETEILIAYQERWKISNIKDERRSSELKENQKVCFEMYWIRVLERKVAFIWMKNGWTSI